MTPISVMSQKKCGAHKREEFRSEAGKLLLVKTDQGYEIKCPRSKKVYLFTYEDMVTEYLTMWDDVERKTSDQESRVR